MSSINPGYGQVPLPSSLSGISSSGKNSSTEKSAAADGSAAKVVDKANSETVGLHGSEKSSDRDADGRQLYDETESLHAPATGQPSEKQSPPPRSKDPRKIRGNQLDLDA